MDEQMQQEIVQLVQAAMQGNEQASQQIQQIIQAAQQGDLQAIQLAQMIQQVAQQLQLQQVLSAKFGAKLNYLRSLKNQCPLGYEMQYFKSGGRICKQCVSKHEDGGVTFTNTDEPITNMPENGFYNSRTLNEYPYFGEKPNPGPYTGDEIPQKPIPQYDDNKLREIIRRNKRKYPEPKQLPYFQDRQDMPKLTPYMKDSKPLMLFKCGNKLKKKN